MSFGDWEMFRVLIVSLREHELTSLCRQDESKGVRFSDNTPRERKSSNPKVHQSERDSNKTSSESGKNRSSNKQSIMEKQVTLEDQMICGALQTLNEEACEDVLEENIEGQVGDIPQTALIPPSPEQQQTEFPFESSVRSRAGSTGGCSVREEQDFVILQASSHSKFHWQPVMGVSSGATGAAAAVSRDSFSQSENSSVCSTPRAKRHKEFGVVFQEPRKSMDNSYITFDLKQLPDNTNQKISDTNIQGQNNINRTSSLHLEDEKPVLKSPKIRQSRPVSLIVSKNENITASSSKLSCIRSKSVEENSLSKKRNLTMKFVGSGELISPTSSLSKLSKIINENRAVSEGPNTVLDSDDESTPLVSDISTPSVSIGGTSPVGLFQNLAYSPKDTPKSPSDSESPPNTENSFQQFSSPEADHKNETNSTDFSPVSPIHAHNLAGGNTAPLNDNLTPPQSYSDNISNSLASLNSGSSGKRSPFSATNLSRQNALDNEERI